MEHEEIYDTLKNRCQERLAAYYAAGIPEPAQERLDRELDYLKNSAPETLDDFLLFSELSDTARRGGFLFSLCGTTLGSMLVFLLGNQWINPLPAHYYCGQCGYFEQTDRVTFGLDLPEKTCPHCGRPLRREGFRLCIESVWEDTPCFEYRIQEMFAPFATKTVEKHFHAQDRATLPLPLFDGPSDDTKICVRKQDAIAVLPAGKTAKDYSDWLCYLADGRIGLEYNYEDFLKQDIKKIILFPTNDLTHLYRLQQATGVFAEEIRPRRVNPRGWRDLLNSGVRYYIHELVNKMRPKSFEETVNAFLGPHNTFAERDSDDDLDIQELLDMPEFQNCPCFSRDDVFDLLMGKGFSRENAFEASEYIRKGKGYRFLEELHSLGLPVELETIARKIRYLFPRSSGVDMALKQLLLAEYMRIDPATYCKIRFAK